MNEQCGKIIKLLAKILAGITEAAVVIGGLITMFSMSFWIGLLILIVGSFLAFLTGLVPYCFGEVVDSLISMDITTTEMYNMMKREEAKREQEQSAAK